MTIEKRVASENNVYHSTKVLKVAIKLSVALAVRLGDFARMYS